MHSGRSQKTRRRPRRARPYPVDIDAGEGLLAPAGSRPSPSADPKGQIVIRKNPHERQDERDIERAARMIADADGLTGAQGVRALEDRAVEYGISVHAAALAAVSTSLRDEPW